jgi:6-phosphogluconolactonase
MAGGSLGCNILAFPDMTLFREAAKRVVEFAREAIAERGRFMAALCGGHDPKPLYTLLATPEWSEQIDWARTHIFWGDERFVQPDNEASNFRMVNETFLSHVPIPPQNIHRVLTEMGTAQEAAAAYEQRLKEVFSLRDREIPQFDLMLLGVGENGHTASLFPYSALLDQKERLVTSEFVKEVDQWRITMTLPVLNNSREVLFLATGARKAEIVNDVLAGRYSPRQYPAQLVRPKSGDLVWLLDTPAASRLKKDAA